MRVRPDQPRWQRVRRHERALASAYLAAVALLLLTFGVPPARQRVLAVVQRGIRDWDDRWTRRVEMGEALVRDGKYEQAATYLARLDREFPARDVRHARDKERERLLVALGRSYTELDRKQRAIETYQRLVAFDPRNYRNSYALGVVSNRLLAGWAPAPEARDAFEEVLRLYPSHLPSLRGAIAFYSARGEFPQVVQLYRSYLDSYLRQDVSVALGDAAATMPAPVDGEFHDYEVPLTRPTGWSGTLRVEAGGFPLSLERATLLAPLRVGEARARSESGLPVGAQEPASKLTLPVPPQGEEVVILRLRLRLFKPMDSATWKMVVPAYRNLLDERGLAAAQARTWVLASSAAADSVLLRPPWASAGLGRGADDTRY